MIQCLIEREWEMPGHFFLDSRKVQAWEESMGTWRVRYGSTHMMRSQTAGYFGFVQTGVSSAWVWCDWLQKHPNRAMLRTGRKAWTAFMRGRPWELYALCATKEERSFAEFCGFEFLEDEDGKFAMRRLP